jgi:hypothetical protein
VDTTAILHALREAELQVAIVRCGARLGKDPVGAICSRLREAREQEPPEAPPFEMRCTVADPQMQRVFAALCARYGVKLFRARRRRSTGIMVREPRTFIKEVLWPIFTSMAEILEPELDAWTDAMMTEFRRDEAGGDA